MDIQISTAFAKINEMVNSVIVALPNIIVAIIVFLLFLITAKWIKRLVAHLTERSGLAQNASLLMGRLTRWLIISFGFLVALSIIIPSFDPGELIQLLGIGGIAVGFAFRDIAQNFLAGILILLTRPFQIDDQIIVGDYEGTVEKIQTRATYIKTYDGRRVVIPNADLFTNSVTVNTAFNIRRSEYDVGIGYESNIDQAKELIMQVLSNIEGVLKEPAPDLQMVELADSSINIRVRWWTDSQQSQVVRIKDQVITEIKRKLDQNNIDIPFPIRTVFFHNETKQNGTEVLPNPQ